MSDQDEAAALALIDGWLSDWGVCPHEERTRKFECNPCGAVLLAAFVTKAREEATREALERAAKIADPTEPLPTDEASLAGMDPGDYGYRSACTDIAREIRALIPPPPPSAHDFVPSPAPNDCAYCDGTGRNLWSYSEKGGPVYRPCPACEPSPSPSALIPAPSPEVPK